MDRRHRPHHAVASRRNSTILNSCNYLPSFATASILSRIIRTVLVICYVLHGIVGECPSLCECKWKSGKESVLCLNANLSNIPLKLDAGTQILDLTGNEISNIPHDTFVQANLLNLQKVFLAKCRLRVIEKYAFRKLNNLVELDMSYNLLTIIPAHAFDSIPELREIKLNGNPILRVLNDAFARTPQLIRIELSDCKIVNVEPRAFFGLESTLEWLKLDGNKLIEIRAETVTHLHNLHGLELTRNPWNCSCHLRPLRAWMLRENIPYDIPPVCRYPQRLNAKSWDKIELDDFACVPQILAPDNRAHGVEGRNITMSCLVEGIPEPNVRWSVKNRVIANLSGETVLPMTQGRKTYMVNLLKNSSNLTILTADIQDAGTYICSAENKAGKVEASVTLAVSRKPPDAPLGAKIILICILIAVLLVVASSMAALCFCSVKKRRRKMPRWSTPARSDSYEKIEMNRKPELRFRNEENGYIRPPLVENGIAIVNPTTKRNGDYRNVPTDDDGTGYEDNNDNSGCSGFGKRDSSLRWKGAATGVKSPGMDIRKTNMPADTDLHIPRLVDLSSNPDSGSSSISSQVEAASRTANTTNTTTFITPLSNWSNQLINKKQHFFTSTKSDHNQQAISFSSTTNDIKNQFSPRSSGKGAEAISINTAETDFCVPSSEHKYPDLLDVSMFCSVPVGGNNSFCTLPRKMKATGKFFKNSSDSQSPLLPESCSKYGSSILSETNFGGDLSSIRRLSAESCNNYPLSQYNTLNGIGAGCINRVANSQRSSSFLNLVPTANSKLNSHRRNPSLPSSPVRESSSRVLSSAATPLLDFSSLTSRTTGGVNTLLMPTSEPSTSSTVNAYDYHAAQLERFLDEYRNLQEQLCKMKETCDSIRKKEGATAQPVLRGALGHSAQFADPVMFNAAITAGSNLAADPPNPKTMLKNKSLLPGQPPDPPPYWLHRNAMLKRLNDSQSEFFQS